MECDINMPCNAYHFENGNCLLALLDKELFYDVQGDDVNNRNIYLNGKYIDTIEIFFQTSLAKPFNLF